MQKNNKKASILIWSIFLSLIISITFIWISTKINKNLNNNYSKINNIEINNEIENIINSWSLNNQTLTNNEKIIFENQNEIIKTIAKNKEYKFKITTDSSDLEIKILDSTAPIKYETKNISWNITNSWIVLNTKIINSTSSWELIISSMWWYSKINLKNNWILDSQTSYKIIKTIWNKNIIKTRWIIKNF